MPDVLSPEIGRPRRALARDQVLHARHVLGDEVPEAARGRLQHLSNRAYGAAAALDA